MDSPQPEQEEAHKNPQEGDPKPQDGGEEETPKNEKEQKELTPEQIEELRKKAEVSSQNYERAKKAEEELKKLKAEQEKGNAPEGQQDIQQLTPKDYLALTEAQVSSQDFDEVLRVSKILGKPISEALQDKTLKQILADRKEERATAQATNAGKSSRGGTRITGETLLEKAEKTGEVPDTPEGMRALAEARIARARKQQQR